MASYAEYYGIVLPAESEVEDGVDFGWGGTEFTGTLTGGGGTGATAEEVAAAVWAAAERTLTSDSGSGGTKTSTTGSRNLAEQVPIQFTFPVASLTSSDFTTKQRYFGSSTTAVNLQGAITFLHTLNGKHWYQLAWNENDRPSTPQVVRHYLADANGNVADFAIKYEAYAANIAVLPGRDRGLPQSIKGRIVVAKGELITIARQVVDGNGSPLSLAGRTLQFVIQDARGNDIAVIPNTDITISGTGNDTYSFAVPAAASAKVGNYTYALNDVGSTLAEIVKGVWQVEDRPLADS